METLTERLEDLADNAPDLSGLGMGDIMGMMTGGGGGLIEQIQRDLVAPAVELLRDMAAEVDDLRIQVEALQTEIANLKGWDE